MNAEIAQALLYFGIGICVVIPSLIVIPFLHGTVDLLTYRNVVLAGCFPFIGLSSIGLATGERPYAVYDFEDFVSFAVFASTFILVFVIAYKYHIPRRSLVAKFVGKPVETSETVIGVLALIAVALSLLDYVMKRFDYLPFFTELLSSLAPSFMSFASLFAIAGWMRTRGNPFLLLILIGIFTFSLVYSILGGGGGRRVLLSVLASFPIFFYWDSRHRLSSLRKQKLLVRIGLIMIPLGLVMTAYSNLRHYDRSDEGTGAAVNSAIGAYAKIPNEIVKIVSGQKMESIFVQIGQDATNCSMLINSEARRGHRRGTNATFWIPQYFHTVWFVLTNPIPRSIWKEKPLALGYMVPIELLGVGGISLGPGIVGHCIHEGGIFFVFFYAICFSYLAKLLDTALVRNPTNLFLQGLATAAFPNLLMLVRGDQAVVLVVCIFGYICYIASRRIAIILRSFA